MDDHLICMLRFLSSYLETNLATSVLYVVIGYPFGQRSCTVFWQKKKCSALTWSPKCGENVLLNAPIMHFKIQEMFQCYRLKLIRIACDWLDLFFSVDIACESPFRFRCENNRCIYSHELCNQEDDCGDGSDEKEEHCMYTQRI